MKNQKIEILKKYKQILLECKKIKSLDETEHLISSNKKEKQKVLTLFR